MKHMVQKRNIDLEIILVLLNGERHLREISRIIGVPHATLLRKLNPLVKEGVLDFSFKGRNKVFFMRDNFQSRNYIYNALIEETTEVIADDGLGGGAIYSHNHDQTAGNH